MVQEESAMSRGSEILFKEEAIEKIN